MSPILREVREAVKGAGPEECEDIVAAFIADMQGRFPLIEDSLVTFIYTSRVALRATVPSDINRWDTKAHEMARLGDTDLHFLTLVMPTDARIDYKFHVDGLWMLDPLNPRTIRGGFGDNSEFSMPDYVPPPEISPVDEAQRGTLDVHGFTSGVIKSTRKIQVYLPLGYRGRRVAAGAILDGGGTQHTDLGFAGTYPVVFVQDGGEYITLASMVNVLDNMIYEKRIPPTIAVFIDPVDRDYEYWLNADYERMLTEEIVPFVRDRYDMSAEPEQAAIMGASLGGAISFMIAMDRPEVFGKCGSQSGAFEVDNKKLIRRAEESPRLPVDFYLDCGMFGDLTPENRQMSVVLTEKGYNLKYQEFNEGHSWGNWRAHIDDMLEFFWGRKEKQDEKMAD